MIDAKTLPPTEQIYTFIDNSGTNVHIHSNGLRLWTLRKPGLEQFLIPVNHRIGRSFLEQNTCSLTKAMSLSFTHLRTPIIFCKDGNLTEGRPDCLLVDGHHRYLRACIEHDPFIAAFVLEPAQWHPFRLKNCPDLTKEELKQIPITPRHY